MDNLDRQDDNQDPQQAAAPAPEAAPAEDTFTWKSQLGTDIGNAPTLQKFDDNAEGLQKAVESHLSLEKLLGHEKVPIPKDANDSEGWARFNKAMGVPDKADGYKLVDPTLPGEMKNLTFDKKQFGDIVHKYHLTPNQAKGLWNDYIELSKGAYTKHMQGYQEQLTDSINALRSEWGDAYDSNVELGQLVINKFAEDKEAADFLTASLVKDPRGVKFLAKVGSQFAENKVGDFKYKRFAMSPDEAKVEYERIITDPSHPYSNVKAPQADHDKAVEYINQLIAIFSRGQGQEG